MCADVWPSFHPSCALGEASRLAINVDALYFADTSLEDLGERSELYHQAATKRNDTRRVFEDVLPGERLLRPVVMIYHSFHGASWGLVCSLNPFSRLEGKNKRRALDFDCALRG